jgi:hypothetical protein
MGPATGQAFLVSGAGLHDARLDSRGPWPDRGLPLLRPRLPVARRHRGRRWWRLLSGADQPADGRPDALLVRLVMRDDDGVAVRQPSPGRLLGRIRRDVEPAGNLAVRLLDVS